MNISNCLIIPVCAILIASSTTLNASDRVASDVNGTEVFELFKNRDRIAKSEVPKKATFKMLTDAAMFDPNQGLVLKDYAVIWKTNEVRMKILYDYLQEPVYVPPGSTKHAYQSIDYDKDKRLIVWRFLETHMIEIYFYGFSRLGAGKSQQFFSQPGSTFTRILNFLYIFFYFCNIITTNKHFH